MGLRVPASAAGLVQRLLHLVARFTRPLTIGVRAVVLDDAGRVFLVKHSYVPGWHFPGGAVEAGETMLEALVREVQEECNIAVRGRPALHGMFFNAVPSRRDHVAVYVVRDFAQLGARPPDWEIVGTGFFALGNLPESTTAATLARLHEIETGAEPAERW